MRYPNHWLLPEGVHEVLPDQAAYLEQVRRRLFDTYRSWGYELVIPPFIEYLDSLLSGTGADLDLQTFKLTDQLTGRLMGIRADITPQVARIDAHQLKRDVPTRLCYLGTVLHTRPDGFARTRSPLQVGAELYGHVGVASDAEILSLMLETLHITQINTYHIDIGHVAIYRELVKQAGLDAEQEHLLFDVLQSKAIPEIHSYLSEWQVDTQVHDMLAQLVYLNGGLAILDEARTALKQANSTVQQALDDIAALAERVTDNELHVDLAELRGYSYHTGLLFSAYVPGHGQAIARGGRYDHVGEVFGRARPASGFSTDLINLVSFNPQTIERQAIFVPVPSNDEAKDSLQQKIQTLREQGHTVICGLPGQAGDAREMGCQQVLNWDGHNWTVINIQ